MAIDKKSLKTIKKKMQHLLENGGNISWARELIETTSASSNFFESQPTGREVLVITNMPLADALDLIIDNVK